MFFSASFTCDRALLFSWSSDRSYPIVAHFDGIFIYHFSGTYFDMMSLGVYRSSITKSDGSFRTTIPLPIAKALELEHKGKMIWELLVDEKYRKYAIVRRHRTRGSSASRSRKG